MSQRTINVETKEGKVPVPASGFIDEIPNFSVTMTNFGFFEVTHSVSGMRISGGFERAINAYVFMAKLQLAINEIGVDSSLCAEMFKNELIKKDKECTAIGMSIIQWINIHKVIHGFSGEFPWESEDEGPGYEFEVQMKKLKN